MFTGIVEELGTVAARDGGRFRFAASRCSTTPRPARPSPSTAAASPSSTFDATAGWWEADAVDETLARTNLDDLAAGDPVNLERPVRLADRLGGHLVQGHVDGVGTVSRAAPDLRVPLPDGLGRYLVEKGSITVDGVSLTVVEARRTRSPSPSSPTPPRSRRSAARARATGSTSRSTSPPSTSNASSPGRMPGCLMPFAKVEEAVAAIGRGEIVVVVDDEDRENEGDLIMAAEFATPEKRSPSSSTTRRRHLRTGHERARPRARPRRRWSQQNTESQRTAFLVTVDAAHGTTTGISAADRAATIQALVDPRTRPGDLLRPGHIFPLEAREAAC